MRVPVDFPPGIVSDDTPYDRKGTWADSSNVRFWRGRPETIGGWSTAVGTALTGTCRSILGWTDEDAEFNIAFGTNSKLQVYKDATLSDITPSSGFTAGEADGAGGPGYGAGAYNSGAYGEGAATGWFPLTWSLSNYGETLIACPREQTIFQWSNAVATPAAAVSNAPAKVTYALVTTERQLLAFGCNEEVSGTFNPMCIRGSDIEGITTWTTAADNNVFEHILEGGNRIVAARLLGSFVAVWTDKAVHLGQFIGESDQTYRFDMVAENCGAIGPNAIAIHKQTAWWVTPDLQIYKWQIGYEPELVQCPIQQEFSDNFVITQAEKLVAASNAKYSEIWFFYPDERDGLENSRYIAVSTLDQTWFRGVLARTAAVDSGAAVHPLAVDDGGNAYWHEIGNTADGSALPWYIQSADFYLGEGERWQLVRGCWPDFENQTGAVSLTFTFKDYPQDGGYTKGPYSLASSTEHKDFLAQGRLAVIKFSGNSAPSYARLGKLTLDMVPTGQK